MNNKINLNMIKMKNTHNNKKKFIRGLLWLNKGLVGQKDLNLAIGERNLSTTNRVKKNINLPKS